LVFVVATNLSVIAQTSPAYQVHPGKTDSDGFPITPAQLCFVPESSEHCYTPPEQDPPFGLDPKSEPIQLTNGAQMLLFTAESSAGGSGSLTIFALIVDRNGQALNLLPKVALTNQSEYAFWSLPEVSAMPVFVTADFLWADGETHFSSHQYRVRAYVYDKQAGRYVERAQFVTAKRYPGLDEVDKIRVLEPEKPELLAKLKQR
jgi:hypothetical protein